MKFFNPKKEEGFTLIEVMISIGLFTVVMIVGITAVLGVNNTYRKSRTMRSAIDNLSFVMEDMARNIRLGINYRCLDNLSNDVDFSVIEDPADTTSFSCPGIAFEPFWDSITGDPEDQVIYFISEDAGLGSIFKGMDGSNTNLYPMNSLDVDIDLTKSGFTIYGSANDDGEQPSVLIRLTGTVSSAGNSTNFNLQTTVSQRYIDFPPTP